MSAAQSAPQNYKNHARFDPWYHFVLASILVLNLVFSIYVTIRHWPEHPHLHPWWIVMSFALLLMTAKVRSYALKVQDRVIRLEERLRLTALLSPAERSQIDQLTAAQVVALRFASDEELPALTHRTLTEGLDPKAIKQSISKWRPDHHRV